MASFTYEQYDKKSSHLITSVHASIKLMTTTAAKTASNPRAVQDTLWFPRWKQRKHNNQHYTTLYFNFLSAVATFKNSENKMKDRILSLTFT
jgi:hypothetical protein